MARVDDQGMPSDDAAFGAGAADAFSGGPADNPRTTDAAGLSDDALRTGSADDVDAEADPAY